MNTATTWVPQKIDEKTVRYISETTFGGSKVATATLDNGKVVFDNDDVPHFIIEDAHRKLGL
jgi:hypothetical protein